MYVTFKLNGRTVQEMPWESRATCPYDSSRYTRVVAPLPDSQYSKKGHKAEVLIVNKGNLKKATSEKK